LTTAQKSRIRDCFFHINLERVIYGIPRYYELYIRNLKGEHFSVQDYRDLQVWFNLAWIDPWYREHGASLRDLVRKDRGFTEQEKTLVLENQQILLKRIIPAYRRLQDEGRIEITTTPYAHPIMPLLHTAVRPEQAEVYGLPTGAAYPQDIRLHLQQACALHRAVFGKHPAGLWPSELGVSSEILSYVAAVGLRWFVADEGILFQSIAARERNRHAVYQPYIIPQKPGDLSVIFRDRELSDLIGFSYGKWPAEKAVDDFLLKLRGIHAQHPEDEALVCVALDGENAWEYYHADGREFLDLLYTRLAASEFVRTVRVSDYLERYPARNTLTTLAAGSWIDARFWKWNGSREKNAACGRASPSSRCLCARAATGSGGREKIRQENSIRSFACTWRTFTSFWRPSSSTVPCAARTGGI
jgi:alpha-amylase/alpha-mannosidase (GH57 family)